MCKVDAKHIAPLSSLFTINMFYELRMNFKALKENYPPKPTFHPDQMPDLTGRVMIVTGKLVTLGLRLWAARD